MFESLRREFLKILMGFSTVPRVLSGNGSSFDDAEDISISEASSEPGVLVLQGDKILGKYRVDLESNGVEALGDFEEGLVALLKTLDSYYEPEFDLNEPRYGPYGPDIWRGLGGPDPTTEPVRFVVEGNTPCEGISLVEKHLQSAAFGISGLRNKIQRAFPINEIPKAEKSIAWVPCGWDHECRVIMAFFLRLAQYPEFRDNNEFFHQRVRCAETVADLPIQFKRVSALLGLSRQLIKRCSDTSGLLDHAEALFAEASQKHRSGKGQFNVHVTLLLAGASQDIAVALYRTLDLYPEDHWKLFLNTMLEVQS